MNKADFYIAELKQPDLWQEAVSTKLRPIFQMLRKHCMIDGSQCETLAKYFIYPNVRLWLKVYSEKPEKARPYDEECTVYRTAYRECIEFPRFEVPSQLTDKEKCDYCAVNFTKHPWRLQILLLWNSTRELTDDGVIEKMFKKCARDVFRQIINNQSVMKRWTELKIADRPKPIKEAWVCLMEGIEKSFQQHGKYELDPALLVGLAQRVNNNLILMMGIQRKLSVTEKKELDNSVYRFINRAEIYIKSKKAIPRRKLKPEIRVLIELIKRMKLPKLEEITDLLNKSSITAFDYQQIKKYLMSEVMPLRSQGLPPGDPLNDQLIQDLFWERVGSKHSYLENRYFDLDQWCRETWKPIYQNGHYIPYWRCT